ncbi:hypothetical protein SADUNF_Sadunf05G0079900 [Salix dunnii]|uniref:Uncharacterized protein n=1 Tax=Salix dunnii TaxID=1413687 RepID=A0A835N216_9ROSI|nr:hypothetical protein SADUNF_Sadunf05G0079900 [Salix dunnii]
MGRDRIRPFLETTGGHINPAVTFGLFVARKVSLVRAVAYMKRHNPLELCLVYGYPILCCLDQVLVPLPIGFAVFVVHLALTGINPARNLGAAVVKNVREIWDDRASPSSYSLLCLQATETSRFF